MCCIRLEVFFQDQVCRRFLQFEIPHCWIFESNLSPKLIVARVLAKCHSMIFRPKFGLAVVGAGFVRATTVGHMQLYLRSFFDELIDSFIHFGHLECL